MHKKKELPSHKKKKLDRVPYACDSNYGMAFRIIPKEILNCLLGWQVPIVRLEMETKSRNLWNVVLPVEKNFEFEKLEHDLHDEIYWYALGDLSLCIAHCIRYVM